MKLSDSGKLREILKKYNPQLQDTEESFEQTYEKVMKGFPDILKKKIREVRTEHKLGQIELELLKLLTLLGKQVRTFQKLKT